ncbi:MAG: hypothetical protein OEL76_13455 [Siculibacillus sp.]|nr:hypothetical protein [Siculibacillus sp.]
MSGPAHRRIYDTSTGPSRGRSRRRVVSALGLLVILFNLVAGTLLATTSRSAAAPFLDEVFGDRIVVCTGAGMIVLDAQGNPIHDEGSVDPMCVFCLPLMQGTADAPTVIALLEAPLAGELVVRTVEAAPAPKLAPAVSSSSPRGPPRV